VARSAGWRKSVPGYVDGFILYDLALGYPAAVKAGRGRVWGELHYYRDLEFALARLDTFEAVGEEYERVRVWVQLAGRRVPAWMYVYPSRTAVAGVGGTRCPSGWWRRVP